MSSLSIPEDYADAFVRAENTFLYQLVYDPVKRKLVPLNDYPDDVDPKELKYAGPYPSSQWLLVIFMVYIIITLLQDSVAGLSRLGVQSS